MGDETKPDHEEARKDANILVRLSERDGTEHGRRAGNVGRAYLASQAENAELRQLIGGEFLEASRDATLTEARGDRFALHMALGEVCGWLESRDPKPQFHAAESLKNARVLLKSTARWVLATPGEPREREPTLGPNPGGYNPR